MSESIDAVAAGHICLDITPKFLTGGRSIAEILRPGTLLNVGEATVSTGGAVSNTGLTLRRLGVDVRLMGKCGDDTFGASIIERIRAEAPGAEEGMQAVAGEVTSYTVVVSPPGIDRIFLHCTGANDTFGAENVDLDVVGRARLFHFGYPPLMARTYADDGAELAKILSGARAAGATTSLDMAYPDAAGPAGRVDWPAVLANALPHVDIFTPSAEELTFLLRRERHDELVSAAGDRELISLIDDELLGELADECIAAGAGVVLIKCGYLGLYLRTAGRERLERTGRAKPGDATDWADRELFEPSYAVESVVSATGSGDSAISGFLAAWLRGAGPDDALRVGCAAGAQNVQVPDAVSGVQSWDRTREMISAGMGKADVRPPGDSWRHDADAGHFLGRRDGSR